LSKKEEIPNDHVEGEHMS